MATYYVSPSGNDSNNGLSADASHASNKPWLTIGKALGASGIASGDTVYIGPGTYREAVTVAMTSAVAETSVLGDPINGQGFKDGSGVLLTAGDVVWTGYTTNDTTAPGANSTLFLQGRDFLTFKFITFFGSAQASGNIVRADTNTSTNIKFIQCVFIPSGSGTNSILITCAANTALHWLVDSCSFIQLKGVNSISMTLTTHTADYDVDFIAQNCLFMIGARALSVTNSASGGGCGTGILVYNCTCIGQTVSAISVTSAGTTQATPSKIENCILVTPSATAVISGHTSQLTENYNWISAATARSNVNAGANSIADQSYALTIDIGQSLIGGRQLRPMFQPVSAPILGFGSSAAAPATDFLQRTRPSGGASTNKSIGYLERHDFATREATVIDASTYAIKLVGPGDHDIMIPVDASATVLSIKTRYDTNHATTNKPQAILLARPDIGVATETKTATAAVDTWDTLTFSSFTPTAKGWVVLRLVSRSAAGNGIAYFDTLTIA